MKVQIVYQNIEKIRPYKFNPRKNQKAVAVVADSIRQFGFLVPIVVDQENEIIAGHTRVEAAKLLGITEVPSIKVENLTEEQVRAFRIMDNKSTEYAHWDRILLKKEFEFLKDKIDMKYTGFRESEIDHILDLDARDITGNKEGKYKIEKGKVYRLGRHRLACADATDPLTYMKLIPSNTQIQCVYTDPPYGVSYKGTNNENGREWKVIDGDNLRNDELYQLLYKSFKETYEYLSKNASLYIFHSSSNQIIFERALNEAGISVRQQLIWAKHHVLGRSHYHWNHEPIFYCGRGEESPLFYGMRNNKTLNEELLLTKEKIDSLEKDDLKEILNRIVENSTTAPFQKDNAKDYIHPTQKPVKMAEHYIVNSTKINENVLDMFAGSGSTLIACENKNRTCYAVELDPDFVSLIIERWEALTGQKATDESNTPLTLK